ncbi:MAG: alpha/beta hydrolase family protein, partial [Pseudomonadales bacterium]
MTRAMKYLGALLLTVSMLGGTAVAAASLPADDYKSEHGPHAVVVLLGVWKDASRNDREVSWKLYLPRSADEPLPVVVWSHGLGGSRNGAEYLGRHLASHGFAAFHIQHPGSDRAVLRRGRAPLIEAIKDPE